MRWIGQFEGNVSSAFDGVGAYFKFADYELGGPLHPVAVDLNTPGRIVFRSVGLASENPPVDFLADIAFVGTGLQIAPAAVPGATFGFPKFTGGTITRLEVRFNDALDSLITALALARNRAEADRIIAQINQIDNRTFFENPANTTLAVIALPNLSAAALGNAVEAAYIARSPVPLIDFLSQFNHIYTAPAEGARLAGFNGDDLLIGGPGGNILLGNGGDDTLDAGGGGGINQMAGGAGSDLYIMSGGTEVVTDDGPFQPDIDIVSYERAPAGLVIDLEQLDGNQSTGFAAGDQIGGVEGVIGSRFGDTIIGRTFVQGFPSSDLLFGGAGDDTIIAGEGSDTLSGGPGFDLLDGGPNFDAVGNPGPPDIAVWAAPPSGVHLFAAQQGGLLVATPGEGVDLVGNVEALQFAGRIFAFSPAAGAFLAQDGTRLDFSTARLGLGGDGAGALTGTGAVDLMFGRGGNDTLSGAGGDDSLDGGEGDDSLDGGTGNDDIAGHDGNDTVAAGEGRDTVAGGNGRDLVFLNQGDDLFLDNAEGGAAGSDTVFGGLGNDRIEGGNGGDAFHGGPGNDVINGRLGDDQIFGGDGFDTIAAGEGADTVHGGNGRDLVFLGTGDDVFFDTGQAGPLGNDSVFGGLGSDWIEGGNGDDVFHGEAGNDVINGRLGSDRLYGGDGFDTLAAGDGNDTVFGGNGRDRVFLGAGDDRFVDTAQAGVLGQDTITGGAGADVFVFFRAMSVDVITDFAIGTDRLHLATALAGGRSAAQLEADAQVTASGVLLDFGNGDRLLLGGLTDKAGLAGDILFV